MVDIFHHFGGTYYLHIQGTAVFNLLADHTCIDCDDVKTSCFWRYADPTGADTSWKSYIYRTLLIKAGSLVRLFVNT